MFRPIICMFPTGMYVFCKQSVLVEQKKLVWSVRWLKRPPSFDNPFDKGDPMQWNNSLGPNKGFQTHSLYVSNWHVRFLQPEYFVGAKKAIFWTKIRLNRLLSLEIWFDGRVYGCRTSLWVVLETIRPIICMYPTGMYDLYSQSALVEPKERIFGRKYD